MDALKSLSSLQCELNIMSAKNIQVNNFKGHLFVRCYLSSGNNKRVRLESREISPNANLLSWNESFSLDCFGTKQSIDTLVQGTVVFELRLRNNTIPLFGKIMGGGGSGGGSRLLGRAEVSWRSVFESPKMGIERWVMMKSKKDVVKMPSIHIAMKIRVPSIVELTEIKKKDVGRLKNKWDERCGCSHGHCCQNSCVDNEIFAIGVALDAF